MNKTTPLILGFAASCLLAATSYSQGLIGERFARVSAVYQDYDINGTSLEGWGGSLDLNIPLTGDQAEFGFDLMSGVTVAEISENGVDFETTTIAGGLRGYLSASEAITPFAEAGLAWTRAEVSGFGFSDDDSTVSLPLTIGVEFQIEQFSITPFYNYNVALEDDFDDTWAVGATAAYWFTPAVGASLTLAQVELDDDIDVQTISLGLILGF